MVPDPNPSNDPSDALHGGHRARLRQRSERDGIERFADHEVLELLLFAVIPRANTNPIAHRLLRRFGSLSATLEADPADLEQVAGVGPRAAHFLALLPPLTRRYLHDRVIRDRPELTTPEAVAEYLVPLMAGRTEEIAYLLCMDAQCRVAHAAVLAVGTVAETPISTRQAVTLALRYRAVSVILAHNHPAGGIQPSQADIEMTGRIGAALATVDIPLLDHLIIAGERHYSFDAAGLLNPNTRLPGGGSRV